VELGFAIAFSVAFALTNGFHDAANAIATLVATRGARPGQAIALAATFNMLGALLVGSAVADTIAGIVTVSPSQTVAVIGAGVLAAVLWNLLTWWRGLPSSSAHALVGGLAGSAFAEAGVHAIRWGGLEGIKPVGIFGVLIALAVSPLLGLGFGFGFARLNRRALRRATKRVKTPIRGAEWAMSAALSFGHGANDAQKSMGVIAALLLASGHLVTLTVPLWVKLVCGGALTDGEPFGHCGPAKRWAARQLRLREGCRLAPFRRHDGDDRRDSQPDLRDIGDRQRQLARSQLLLRVQQHEDVGLDRVDRRRRPTRRRILDLGR
jgi:PiT family inorganic phosphate transporter